MGIARGMMLSDAMFEVFAVSVSYRRGEDMLASGILSKLGSTLFRADNNRGVTIRTEQRDFIVRTSDFVDNFEPQPGDEIIFDGKLYMVSAPNDEVCWRWHSRLDHSQLRIHAKYAGNDD